jgi:hypothetical protein
MATIELCEVEELTNHLNSLMEKAISSVHRVGGIKIEDLGIDPRVKRLAKLLGFLGQEIDAGRTSEAIERELVYTKLQLDLMSEISQLFDEGGKAGSAS